MSASMPNVYVSYAWGGESEKTVDDLQRVLQQRGIPFVRDKAELGYKGRIREFMQEIGRGHAVVVVLSDKYLRSPNCMLELVEIMRHGEMHERIFPIVLGDADIYDMARRLQYKKHWKDKLEELNAAAREVGLANLHNAPAQASQYDRFGDHVMELADLFGDMNALTPAMHASSGYAELVAALEAWLRKAAQGGAAPAGAAPAAGGGGPQVFGLASSLARLLDPDDGSVTEVQLLAMDEDDRQTLLLSLWIDGDTVQMTLGDDFADLDLPPAAHQRLAAAAHTRTLGRLGQLTPAHLQAAAAGAVDSLFGLPDARRAVRAVVVTAQDDDDALAGVPGLAGQIDELLADAGIDGTWADVRVAAVDDATGDAVDLLAVARYDDDTVSLLADLADAPPEDLAMTRDRRRALRELGFAADPDRGGCLALDLGARPDLDPDEVKDLVVTVLDVLAPGEDMGWRLESRPGGSEDA